MRHLHWAMIPILLVALWLRSHDLTLYPIGMSDDEAKNVIDAVQTAYDGVFPLYQEGFDRPEPAYRGLQALFVRFAGGGVWGLRWFAGLLNVLVIAVIFRTAQAIVADCPRMLRLSAGLLAAAVLTVMVGHIALSRSLYRVPLFFLALSLSLLFMARAVRTYRLRDGVLSGVFAGGALYTYTASWFFPLALPFAGLALVLFRLRVWRKWLRVLIVAAVSLIVVAAPLLALALENPDNVFGRSGDLAASYSPERIAQAAISQLLEAGDENPQYNAASAPVIANWLQGLFFVLLAGVFWRVRQALTWVVLALFVIMNLPAVLSNEFTHGLRISGQYVAIPLLVSVGFAGWGGLLAGRLQRGLALVGVLVAVVVLGYGSVQSWQTYRDYWDGMAQGRRWRIFERDLHGGEWFMRADRQDFAAWLQARAEPVLLPVAELQNITTRAWLAGQFPRVVAADERFVLPEDSLLVMPYSVAIDDLLTDAVDYALLRGDTITLLPPLSEGNRAALVADIEDSGERLERAGDQLTFLGYARPIPDDFALVFEDGRYQLPDRPLAEFEDGALAVAGWYGAENLSAGDVVRFKLAWAAQRQTGYLYFSDLQIQTQDFQRVAGTKDQILRYLYPPILWNVGDTVHMTQHMSLPDDLPVGAYRLMAGLSYGVRPPIAQHVSYVGESLETSAMIGWLKVPQAAMPSVPDAPQIDALINGQFQLLTARITETEAGSEVRLYWQALEQRPLIDATIFVHLLDENGEIVAQNDARPWGGQYPTFIWDDGEIVETVHPLNLAPGGYDLRVGMYTFPGPQNLPAEYEGQTRADGLLEVGAAARFVSP